MYKRIAFRNNILQDFMPLSRDIAKSMQNCSDRPYRKLDGFTELYWKKSSYITIFLQVYMKKVY